MTEAEDGSWYRNIGEWWHAMMQAPSLVSANSNSLKFILQFFKFSCYLGDQG